MALPELLQTPNDRPCYPTALSPRGRPGKIQALPQWAAPLHPSTIVRWITKGTHLQGGGVLKLRARPLPRSLGRRGRGIWPRSFDALTRDSLG